MTATYDTICAIVSIFETGRLPSPDAYATATVLADGAGVSYGAHQATAHSGSLLAVVAEYYDQGGTLEGWSIDEARSAVRMSVGRDPSLLPRASRSCSDVCGGRGGTR